MKKRSNFFKDYKKMFTDEFRGYNASKLLRDILAGLTVGAVALPLALAFGAASVGSEFAAIGISAGLITAIVAGIVTGFLGGGSFQVSGPTGAMTVVLGAVVAGEYGIQGMFVACLMAGLILLIAGFLKIGKLIQFIPKPVVTGFTSGIAIVIALGQLGNFFGVSLEGENTVSKLVYFFTSCLSKIDITTVICSVAVVLLMVIYPKKFAKYVPGSLVAIIIITAAVAIFKIDIKTIGDIPASLVNSITLDLSKLTPDMITKLAGSAFTIAALGMVESLLCGTCAANMKHEKFDSNIELVAQGIGNIVIPFLGGVPSTAAIARTSVAIKSGCQTRLTSVFQSLFLIVCMFVLSDVIGIVPYAALAGVLVITAWRMNEWHEIKYYFKNKLWDAVAMFLITMVATVLLDLTYAILIGVILALVILVSRLAHINIETSDVKNEDGEDSVIIYCTGALFFANGKEISRVIENLDRDYTKYVIVLRGIVYLDVSAVEVLAETVRELSASGKKIVFTGVRDDIMRVFEKCKFVEEVGVDNFHDSIDKFLLN